MKKRNSAFLLMFSLLMIFALCACGKAAPADSSTVANPRKEISADAACAALYLKQVDFGPDASVETVASLDGDPVIYSFDLKVNGRLLNVRIALAKNGNASPDISGVHLSDKAEQAIFDSADSSVPSVSAGADKEYARAYCEWNGYYFSLSGKDLTLNAAAELCMKLAPAVIGADNLTQDSSADL